jgi:hypothetical protein
VEPKNDLGTEFKIFGTRSDAVEVSGVIEKSEQRAFEAWIKRAEAITCAPRSRRGTSS